MQLYLYFNAEYSVFVFEIVIYILLTTDSFLSGECPSENCKIALILSFHKE